MQTRSDSTTTLAPGQPTTTIPTTVLITTTIPVTTTTPLTTTTPAQTTTSTTTTTTTTTTPVCVNGVGSSCLAFDRADTANIREGTEAPISTSPCTTAPISKSCYNSHTEAESMNVKSGPVPSRVKVITGSAFCDPQQTSFKPSLDAKMA
ncbi:hypothetical protein DdX_17748 [Ditylenchus destructor]|uniref:Uncharacterized protein n=1 Tax=Ditylenchus destructor TaxID=166010 RepID=A0AAD4MQS7_9BILA|nr:hypothetical protein DdX_17748 [Ditylenchus destructor]